VTVDLLTAVPGLAHGFGQRSGAPSGSASGPGPAAILLMSQVHGRTLRHAPWEGMPEGDACVAAAGSGVIGIKTADCLPVLIADQHRRVVAAAHAGWRGTAAGVAGAAVEALVAGGSDPRDLVAALGPGIGPCCYEVGDDVKAALGPAGRSFFVAGPRGRYHLDVRRANRAQLRAAGLADAAIASVDHCTFCRADLYHSYRRDGPRSGRMVSFVGFS
jgi:hypothetical protein